MGNSKHDMSTVGALIPIRMTHPICASQESFTSVYTPVAVAKLYPKWDKSMGKSIDTLFNILSDGYKGHENVRQLVGSPIYVLTLSLRIFDSLIAPFLRC
jgi:hypothetical protein